MSGLILLVESMTGARRTLRLGLEQAGYAVRSMANSGVIQEAQQIRPTVVVLDPVTADVGVRQCRSIRQNPLLTHVSVVLLTDGTEESQVAGLEAGADACVAEFTEPLEIVKRTQSVIRRAQTSRSGEDSTVLVIDRAAMKLSVGGNEIATTSLEFRLVDYLALHRGRVFTRDLLLDAVWGEMHFVTPRCVDSCIRRVRDKIEPDRANPVYLKTVRGVGYRFDAVAVWPQG